MPNNKIIKRHEVDLNPAIFVQQAIEKGLSVEVMERVMNLYDRWEAKKSKKEFDAALAAFQGECPIIDKGKKVNNKDGTTRYRYAPLDAIVKQVGKLISKHGLSYTVNATQEPNKVKATVVVTHVSGYSQPSSFEITIDGDAFMTAPQKAGAAMTYAKRYAFCNAFGILTSDPDNDAQGYAEKPAADELYKLAVKEIQKADTLERLDELKYSFSAGRGKKAYGKEQAEQLIRLIDEKRNGLGN